MKYKREIFCDLENKYVDVCLEIQLYSGKFPHAESEKEEQVIFVIKNTIWDEMRSVRLSMYNMEDTIAEEFTGEP